MRYFAVLPVLVLPTLHGAVYRYKILWFFHCHIIFDTDTNVFMKSFKIYLYLFFIVSALFSIAPHIICDSHAQACMHWS